MSNSTEVVALLKNAAVAKASVDNVLRNLRRIYDPHVLAIALLDYAVTYARDNGVKVGTTATLVGHIFRGASTEGALLHSFDEKSATKQ